MNTSRIVRLDDDATRIVPVAVFAGGTTSGVYTITVIGGSDGTIRSLHLTLTLTH